MHIVARTQPLYDESDELDDQFCTDEFLDIPPATVVPGQAGLFHAAIVIMKLCNSVDH